MNESVISLKQANYGHSNSHLHHSTLHLPSHFTNLTNHVNSKSSLSTAVGKCQLSTNSSSSSTTTTSPSPSSGTNIVPSSVSTTCNGSNVTVTNLLGTFKSDSLVTTHTSNNNNNNSGNGTLVHSLSKCNNNNLLTNDHLVIGGGGNSVVATTKIHYQNGSHGPVVNGSTISRKDVCSNSATEIVYLDSEGDENMISPPPEDSVDESASCIEVIDHDDDDDDVITVASSRVNNHRPTTTLSPRADRFLNESPSTSVQNSNHKLNVNPMLTSTPTKSPQTNGNTIASSVGGHTLPPLNSSVDSSILDLASGGLFDPSLISRVNLHAAFHDHLPCTKIYRKILPYSSHTSGLTNSTSVLGTVGVGDSLMSIISPLKSTHSSHHNSSHHRPPSNPDHLDYVDTSLQVPSTNCNCSSYSEEREQIKFLQEIILSHFDLIEFQKEQIQKKDRQLLALKQDREALLGRSEKLEKKVKFLSKKLVTFAESKQAVVSISSINGEAGETTSGQSKGSCIQNGTLMNDSNGNQLDSTASNLLKAKKGKLKNSTSSSGSNLVKIDGQPSAKKKRSVSTSFGLDSPTGSPSKKKHRTLSNSVNCKSQTNSNLLSDGIDTSCDSSSSVPSGICGGSSSSNTTTPLPPNGPVTMKRKLPIMKDFLTTDETYEVVQMRDPTYEAACLARRSKLSIQAGVLVRTNCPTNGKVNGSNSVHVSNGKNGSVTTKGKTSNASMSNSNEISCDNNSNSNSVNNNSNSNSNNNNNNTSKNGTSYSNNNFKNINPKVCEVTKTTTTNNVLNVASGIEVPSFRIINIAPSNSSDGAEPLDDEVFLKRHNKLELDERRRKR